MIETELPCLIGMSGLVLLEAVRVGYEICTLQLDDPCFGGLLPQPGASDQAVSPEANVSGDKMRSVSTQCPLVECSLNSRLLSVSLRGSLCMLSSLHLVSSCSALKLQICDRALLPYLLQSHAKSCTGPEPTSLSMRRDGLRLNLHHDVCKPPKAQRCTAKGADFWFCAGFTDSWNVHCWNLQA